MKRITSSFLLSTLTFLVLLGSGGFTVGKMICGGNECSIETYSLGKAKDCCASENGTEELSSCCCELIDVSYSLDAFSISEKISITAQVLPCLNDLPSFSYHLPTSIVTIGVNDSSPPDPRDLLLRICTLRL